MKVFVESDDHGIMEYDNLVAVFPLLKMMSPERVSTTTTEDDGEKYTADLIEVDVHTKDLENLVRGGVNVTFKTVMYHPGEIVMDLSEDKE